MKDLLIRLLVSVVVSAMLAGGIMYFAFDQALRGVEVSIDSTNERISDNGARLLEIERALTAQSEKLNQIDSRINTKLDSLISQTESESERRVFVRSFETRQFATFQSELARSVGTMAQMADYLAQMDTVDAQLVSDFRVLAATLREQSDSLRIFNTLIPFAIPAPAVQE